MLVEELLTTPLGDDFRIFEDCVEVLMEGLVSVSDSLSVSLGCFAEGIFDSSQREINCVGRISIPPLDKSLQSDQ